MSKWKKTISFIFNHEFTPKYLFNSINKKLKNCFPPKQSSGMICSHIYIYIYTYCSLFLLIDLKMPSRRAKKMKRLSKQKESKVCNC